MNIYSTLKITIGVFMCLFSLSCFADETIPSSNMIQFKNYVTTDSKMAMVVGHKEIDGVINVDPKKLSKKISDIRNGLCQSVKPGSIEFWIEVGVGGSLSVLNYHADTGIKITIQCN
jgi:hypothetical protein